MLIFFDTEFTGLHWEAKLVFIGLVRDTQNYDGDWLKPAHARRSILGDPNGRFQRTEVARAAGLLSAVRPYVELNIMPIM